MVALVVRDAIVINTKKDPYFFDEFGFMHMPNAILSNQGVFDYIYDDGTVVSALMPVETLKELADDCTGCTITLEHPQDESGEYTLLSPENYKNFAKGYLASGLRVEEGNLLGDLVIADRETQEAILDKSKKGISLGYKSHSIAVPGIDENGKPFDVIKKGLKLNQISVVENPRASKALFSLDSTEYTLDNTFKRLLTPTLTLDSKDFKPIKNDLKNKQMTIETKTENNVDQLLDMQSKLITLQANFDSLKATLDETAKQKETLAAELDASKSAADGLTAAFDSYKASQPTEEVINAQVAERVNAWAKAEGKVTFDSNMSALDIQRARLSADHPNNAEAFKTASAEYLSAFEAAFDSLQAATPKAPKPTFDSTSVPGTAVAPTALANSVIKREDGSYSLFDLKAKNRK